MPKFAWPTLVVELKNESGEKSHIGFNSAFHLLDKAGKSAIPVWNNRVDALADCRHAA